MLDTPTRATAAQLLEECHGLRAVYKSCARRKRATDDQVSLVDAHVGRIQALAADEALNVAIADIRDRSCSPPTAQERFEVIRSAKGWSAAWDVLFYRLPRPAVRDFELRVLRRDAIRTLRPYRHSKEETHTTLDGPSPIADLASKLNTEAINIGLELVGKKSLGRELTKKRLVHFEEHTHVLAMLILLLVPAVHGAEHVFNLSFSLAFGRLGGM